MSNDFENLKKDIQALYPGESFTDFELNQMAERLIKFFTIGAKNLYKQKQATSVI